MDAMRCINCRGETSSSGVCNIECRRFVNLDNSNKENDGAMDGGFLGLGPSPASCIPKLKQATLIQPPSVPDYPESSYVPSQVRSCPVYFFCHDSAELSLAVGFWCREAWVMPSLHHNRLSTVSCPWDRTAVRKLWMNLEGKHWMVLISTWSCRGPAKERYLVEAYAVAGCLQPIYMKWGVMDLFESMCI